jgi:uncharacterized protein (TIGR02266 family)
MSADSGSPAHFRENSRAALQAPATVQIDSFSEPLSGYTANISLGGMFIQTENPVPVGSIVRFQVELGFPAGTVRGTAEVVWMRAKTQGAQEPAGIGLQFRFVEEDGEPLLRTAVQQALEELGPEPEPTEPVKRRPRPPRPPRPQVEQASTPNAVKGKRKAKKKKKVAPKSKQVPDDSKQILGMPAEKAKLILLLILVAFMLLVFVF